MSEETKSHAFKVGDRVRLADLGMKDTVFKQNRRTVCKIVHIDPDCEKPYRVQSKIGDPILEAPITHIHDINVVESVLIRAEGIFTLERVKEGAVLGGRNPFNLVYQLPPPNDNRSTTLNLTNNEIKELFDCIVEFRRLVPFD